MPKLKDYNATLYTNLNIKATELIDNLIKDPKESVYCRFTKNPHEPNVMGRLKENKEHNFKQKANLLDTHYRLGENRDRINSENRSNFYNKP